MPLDPRHIKAAFNKAADSYEDFAHLQRDIADSLLKRLEWIPCAPDRILDVGCGTGYAARQLAEKYPTAQIVGVDLAAKMLTRSDTPSICANANALPLANQSMDVVYSNLMLQWCDDYPQVFLEFARVLKPDGILLFTSFGPDTLKELRASWQAADGAVHVNKFVDMHELGDALLGTGFINPVMDVERLTRHYPDSLSLMRELKGIGAHNVNQARSHGLTGKQRLQQMQSAYEKHRSPAGLPASYEVIYGFARGGGAFEFMAYAA